MLAVLSLVHQTSRVTSSDCSYDRCGSLMKVCLHASVFYVLLPTATSHASSLAGALIRPRIASEEVQASPDAKSLLDRLQYTAMPRDQIGFFSVCSD